MKVLVVGGGAAGLMAAGAALRQGHEVTVLEHMEKPAQKILVTGKGRCNVTNDCTAEEFLHHVRTNPRFLFSSLGAFPPAKTMELFESLGVELKVERGRRVFPVSDKAEEIRQALLRYADGADIVHDAFSVSGATACSGKRSCSNCTSWSNRMVVTLASPSCSFCRVSMALNPPMVSGSSPPMEPLRSRIKTSSVRFFFITNVLRFLWCSVFLTRGYHKPEGKRSTGRRQITHPAVPDRIQTKGY